MSTVGRMPWPLENIAHRSDVARWLADARAEAWEEGAEAGRIDEFQGGWEPPTNPYRSGDES